MDLIQFMTSQYQVVTNHLVAQSNQGGGPQPSVNIPTSRIKDFMRINPSTFYGTKMDEDAQSFKDEIFKAVGAMGMTPRERAELAAYQLKDVAQVWFDQWRD